MTLEKIIINSIHEFNCYEIQKTGQFPTEYFSVVISSQDFQRAKEVMVDINTIEIADTTGKIRLSTSDYGRYQNITFQDKLDFPQYKNPETETAIDTFKVVFKPTDLEEKVNKLFSKVNPVFDEASMSFEEYYALKKKELGETCRKKIYEGCDIDTDFGTEHFTFNADDQLNLNALYLAALNTGLPQSYHPSTTPPSPCTIYPAKDILTIYLTLQSNLLYHQTYCNMLNTLLGRYTSKEEMKSVTYGMELPRDLKERLDIAVSNRKNVLDALSTMDEHHKFTSPRKKLDYGDQEIEG